MKKLITYEGKSYIVEYAELRDDTCLQVARAAAKASEISMERLLLRSIRNLETNREILDFYGKGLLVNATLPGKVIRLCVEEGAEVKQGEALVLVESMKMENEIQAPCDGVVRFLIPEDIVVKQGEALLLLE